MIKEKAVGLHKPFYRVEEAAEILDVATSTVTSAINQKTLAAVVLTGDHRSTRIPHAAIFGSNDAINDFRTKRIKRLTLDMKRKQEMADRLCREWGEAQLRANEAAQALYDELGLQDVDSALERMGKWE